MSEGAVPRHIILMVFPALDKPDAKIVAAGLVVEVIDERPLHAVVKEDPDHAKATGKRGVFFFDHLPLSPKSKAEMPDGIADFQI